MTQKTFIPFYEVKNHVGDVLVVDAHHAQGFDLSHWRGAPVPEGCEADTSTEIVLNAIDHKLPELEKTFVTNNHYDIDGFLHANDLSYVGNPDEEIKKYKKGAKLKVKILEVKKDENKVRVGLKQTGNDPFEWFKDKQINETVTVKVISSDSKGLIIKPEGCELDFMIKKSNIAINSSDARPARFVGGERIDAAILELDFNKRKANFSIKLLEELRNKEVVSKFSSPLSGKNLPFSSLSDKLDDKSKKKIEE